MRHAYTTKSGRTLYKVPAASLADMYDDLEGWCLVCGETVPGCEPEAVRYRCDCCGESLVFGPLFLARRKLTY